MVLIRRDTDQSCGVLWDVDELVDESHALFSEMAMHRLNIHMTQRIIIFMSNSISENITGIDRGQ